MEYLPRELETEFHATCAECLVVVVTGVWQVGKSTMLEHFLGEGRRKVTLDDLEERALAQEDPEFLLQSHRPPVLIDEVQYAPELFPYLESSKERVGYALPGKPKRKRARLGKDGTHEAGRHLRRPVAEQGGAVPVLPRDAMGLVKR